MVNNRLKMACAMMVASACAAYAAKPWNDQVEALSSLSEGTGLKVYQLVEETDRELTSGIYYLADDLTFTGQNAASNSEVGGNGLRIATNATVYIYIPKDKTLTAIGGNGQAATEFDNAEVASYVDASELSFQPAELNGISFRVPVNDHGNGVAFPKLSEGAGGGAAGILVPPGSKLVIMGEGTVKACGGRGGRAGGAQWGGDTTYLAVSWYADVGCEAEGPWDRPQFAYDKKGSSLECTGTAKRFTTYSVFNFAIGAGGNGGGGAGGGGAAIGSNGGRGGTGGKGGETDKQWTTFVKGGNEAVLGVEPEVPPTEGGRAADCGEIYICESVIQDLQGGRGGLSGDLPVEPTHLETGMTFYEGYGTGTNVCKAIIYGADGGGGGAGGKGAAIGCGGSGAAGGAGGCSGGAADEYFCGTNGTVSVLADRLKEKTKVGANGADGTDGSSKEPGVNYPFNTITVLGAAPEYQPTNYYLTTGMKVTLPQYEYDDLGQSWLVTGWQVVTNGYALPPEMGGNAETNGLKRLGMRYDSGAEVDTTGVYGNVVLKRVGQFVLDETQPVEKMYDGVPTNITVKVIHPPDGYTIYYMLGENGDVPGEEDSRWKTNMLTFVDVGTNTVWYKVWHPEFWTVISNSTVTITKRPVTIRSKDDWKYYDGTPLECHEANETAGYGFVAGDVKATNFTGSIIRAGEAKNDFSVLFVSDTKAGDYELTYEYGKLTVLRVPIDIPEIPDQPPPEWDEKKPYLCVQSVTKEYDGTGTNVTAWVIGGVGDELKDVEIKYSLNPSDGYVDWADLQITNVVRDLDDNVVSTKVWVTAKDTENYIGTNCYAWVCILPREATVTAGSATWEYDTTEHATNSFTAAGFLDGEGIASVTMTPESRITNVGSVSNEIATLTPKAGTLLGNYTVTRKQGELKVTKARQPDPDDPSVVKMYDGEPTNIVVKTELPTPTVSYSFDGETWYPEDEFEGVTDVTNKQPVVYKIEVPNYEDYVGTGTVTVIVRPVTISSGNATRPYNGEPLVCEEAAVTNGLDFVAGDVVRTNFTGTITNAGVVPNTFAVTFAPGKEGDYELKYEYGKLEVTRVPIIPDEPGDPDDPPPVPGPDAPELFARNVVKPYDGEGTNVTAEVYGLVEGNTVEIRYSLDPAGEFVEWDKVQVTNVVRDADGNVASQKVWITALDSQNYLCATGFAWVCILPLEATVTAGSAEWTYDTTEHATNSFTAAGFLDGEGIASVTMTPESRITNVGSVSNVIDELTAKAGTLLGNYTVTKKQGELKVTKARQPDPEVPPVEKMYDGEPTNIVVKTELPTPTVSFSFDGETWYPEDEFEGVTDVTNKQPVVYRIEVPNYEDYVGTGTVTVTKRPVTISSGNATRPYNGEPLVCEVAAVTNGLDFVAGDVVRTNFTGTITNAGVETNYFTVTFAPGKEGDYELTYEYGTLEVTRVPIIPDEPGDPDDPPPVPGPDAPELFARNVVKPYDGEGTNVTAEVYGLVKGNTVEIRYSLDPAGEFVEWDKVQVTNVVRDADGNVASQKVWITALDSQNYLCATGFAWVCILPLEATVTAGSAEWTYDGEEHATNSFTAAGFLPGEGIASVTMTSESRITNVGSVSNVIDELTAKAGTLLGNYTVTEKQGELKVTKARQPDPDDPSVVKMYDGEPTNIVVKTELPEPTVTYSFDGKTWYPEDKFEGVTDVTNKQPVVYRIEVPNYEDYVGTGTVTVIVRPVTISSGNATRPYNGEPLVCEEAAVTNGLDFVAGDVVRTNFTGTITNAGVETNYFTVTFAEGKAGDYELTYEYGTLEVTRVPIIPDEPGDPDDPPPVPGPDAPELFARNVVKPYDGEGTNVTAEVYGLLEGNTVEIRYSLDPAGEFVEWDKVQVTNVVRDADGNVASQKVWITALDSQNYLCATGFAWVCILPREATVTAGSAEWTYDGNEHRTDTFTTDGFVEGQGIASVTMTSESRITNVGSVSNVIETYEPKEGTDLGNYKVTLKPGTLTVIEDDGLLTARLSWSFDYNTGTYFAKLRIACTNDFRENIDAVWFVVEDRYSVNEPQLLNVALWDSTATWDKSDPNSQAAKAVYTFGGKKFRRYALDIDKIGTINPGDTIPLVYGLTSTQEKTWYDYKETQRNKLRKATPEVMYRERDLSVDIGDYYMYVMWQTNGRDYWLPVVGWKVTELKDQRTVATKWNGVEFEALKAPVMAETLNLALALGLVLADTSNPICKLTEFNVTGNRVSGRIATICEDEESSPSDLAKVVLWGTKELGKPFVRICEVHVDEDGSFSQEVDGQYRFFKVSIEPSELLR